MTERSSISGVVVLIIWALPGSGKQTYAVVRDSDVSAEEGVRVAAKADGECRISLTPAMFDEFWASLCNIGWPVLKRCINWGVKDGMRSEISAANRGPIKFIRIINPSPNTPHSKLLEHIVDFADQLCK